MAPVGGSCLCGDVAWEADRLDAMSHCHCSRCRKSHGAAFASFALCDPAAFRLRRGRDRIVPWESAPGILRPFCRRCGGPVPDGTPWNGHVGIPAGPLDDDPGVRPVAHIFVASKAPWFEVEDALPRFDAYPPGLDPPAPPAWPAPPADATGSCLCGAVAYVVDAPALRGYHCHCSRCRKARGAAHASNMVTAVDGLRFLRGEDALASYEVPEARSFTQVFCRACGSPMPRADRERGIAIVPMGSLDVDPGFRPLRHIFVASKAPWYEIPGDLPQDVAQPPPA